MDGHYYEDQIQETDNPEKEMNDYEFASQQVILIIAHFDLVFSTLRSM